MNEKKTHSFDFASGIETWMKSVDTLWRDMLNSLDTNADAAHHQDQTGGNTQKTINATLESWQTLFLTLCTPESMLAILKSGEAMPEMLFQLSQPSMDSVMEFHQRTLQQTNRLGKSVKACQFQNLDESVKRLWTDLYEKDLRQFLQLPQLGLMRQYQERVNQAVDKYHLFQSQLSDYLNLLSKPFTRAACEMQEKLIEMVDSGRIPDDSKTVYNMWIKVLEGHFMTLFQTTEYVETQARTLNALADFSAARDAVIEDVIQLLPIAKQTDLDDMARELYELKKRVNRLEKTQHHTTH